MATGGIAMQGISAAIVIEAINKISKMIADADALMAAKVEPAINRAISEIPDRPDSLVASYSDSRSTVRGALSKATVLGSAPVIASPPALIEQAVVSFFEDYTTVIDGLFLPALLAICTREVVAGRKWKDLKVLGGLLGYEAAKVERLLAGGAARDQSREEMAA